jgi:cytochrome b561
MMLASVVLCVAAVRALPARNISPSPIFLYGLTAMAAFMVIAILVLRRLWVLPAESVLAAHPEDRATTLRWQTGYLVTYALSEAIALYGVALHFIGFSFPQVILFCLAGFGLLLFFRPPTPKDGTTS